MMRRVLTIILILLGVTCANAQAVWISPDGYCQYAVIDFGRLTAEELKLSDKHRPSLDFIAYLIDQYTDKIGTQEYQVWVESYVGEQEANFAANRALARKMSNVVKSHIILNDGLTEDNFKTRNYCGTFGGQSGVTIVVIGMRYPVEQIVPMQRLFYEQINPDVVDGISVDMPFDSLGAQKVITAIGVDTIPVLYPDFEVMTLGGSSSNEVQTSGGRKRGDAASMGHALIVDDTFTAPQSANAVDNSGVSSGDEGLSYDKIIEQGPQKNAIPGLIVDQSIHNPGLPKLWQTDSDGLNDQPSTTEQSTQSRSSLAVASGVAALALTSGAVTTIVDLTTVTNPIKGQFAAPSTQKSKHQRQVNKKIEEQLRQQKEQQKEQQKQDKLLAKEQTKQQIIDQKASARNKRLGKATTSGEQAKISRSELATAPGSVASDGAEIMTFDKATSQAAWAKDNASKDARQTPQSSIDQDSQPMPLAPLSYGTKKEDIVQTLPTKKRGSKNQPLDGKSIEESINQAIIAKQKVAERVERTKKEQAVRDIVQKKKVEKFRQVQMAKGRFAVAGIGVNLLSSAALIPSVQVDSYFGDRFSIAAEWYYSMWNFNQKNIFNLSMASLELRFFCMGKKKAFEGLYVGLYGGVGEYDFRWGSQDGRQSQFLNVGLSLGYVMPLGKSGFYFEAGISGGYVAERIEKYIRYDEGYVRLNEGFNNSTIFAPTKIKLSIIYRIFNQKR